MNPGSEEFSRLADPYRRELLAYCYRMLGSLHDAEDQVQETFLRAWKSYDRFEGRSSLRTWLYRIATNACLRALENRGRRPLPSGLGPPAEDATVPFDRAPTDVPWLEPIPDALFADEPSPPEDADPAAIVVSRESMRLALIAALQYLPARQRAVLILREVLAWSATETAQLLDLTVPAVNSLLQRARERLQRVGPVEGGLAEPTEPERRELLDRYAAAFAAADVDALTALLADDAVYEMPPQPVWFAGRSMIGTFFATHVFLGPDTAITLVPTAANGQPAAASYRRDTPGGPPRAHSIQVLTIENGLITHGVSFRDPALFRWFDLPDHLTP
ncbi:MAG: sigma-70 family RNA polymerase sigma factor [Mycobacteriales bacterium]